jgi:uncharacterized protein
MHSSLRELDHRPWPLPSGGWRWTQSWYDLLFAHWPVPADVLRTLIPDCLEVDEFGGEAWIGIVPFHMSIRPRVLPHVPGISRFAELNVRTYVRHRGKAGVWFFSLDAASATAVFGGRTFFHLPYFRADIAMKTAGDSISHHCQRRDGVAEFAGRYAPCSEPFVAETGCLDHWLTERYCLYTMSPAGKLLRGDIHHKPWPLQHAEAEIERQTMHVPTGLTLPDCPPVLHFASAIDTVLWPLSSPEDA